MHVEFNNFICKRKCLPVVCNESDCCKAGDIFRNIVSRYSFNFPIGLFPYVKKCGDFFAKSRKALQPHCPSFIFLYQI